jgi:hypothetical protein
LSVLRRSLAIGAISVSLIAVTIGYFSYVRPLGEEPPSGSATQVVNDSDLNGTDNSSPNGATEVGTPTLASDLTSEREPILGSAELAKNSRPVKQLKPYVALALTTTQQTTEKLCPELAQEVNGRENSGNSQEATPASTTKSERNEKGCVLPIGDEQSAAATPASMPIQRPPTFFGRPKFNYMPYLGGLGAAIATVPVINGLSTNKHNQQPISPE